MIKSVLIALPVYLLAIIDPLAVTISEIQMLASNLFWNDNSGSHRCHWVSWEKISRPCEEGGLGIRTIKDLEEAFAYKLWWRLRENNSSWS